MAVRLVENQAIRQFMEVYFFKKSLVQPYCSNISRSFAHAKLHVNFMV